MERESTVLLHEYGCPDQPSPAQGILCVLLQHRQAMANTTLLRRIAFAYHFHMQVDLRIETK